MNEGIDKGLIGKLIYRFEVKIYELWFSLVYLFRPIIIFESRPFFSDNTKPVYEEMIRRGLGKKYSFIWAITEDEEAIAEQKKLDFFILCARSPRMVAKELVVHKRTKCIVFCNRILKPGKKQVAFYLSHGMPIKNTSGYYNLPISVQYCISLGRELSFAHAESLHYPVEKIISLGFPRNDVLFNATDSLLAFFPEAKGKYCKVVIWYPTFKQMKGVKDITNCQNAIPLLHDVEAANSINEAAKDTGILLLIKPHFAQDISYITKKEYSNIKFIDESFFDDIGLSSYEVLARCDALVTDYSSVYYDYLLCDKPIGLVWEDINDYAKNPGFAVNLDCYMQGGEKIYSVDDMVRFLNSVATNQDDLQTQRREIRDKVFDFVDASSTKRVTDFIIEKASLI